MERAPQSVAPPAGVGHLAGRLQKKKKQLGLDKPAPEVFDNSTHSLHLPKIGAKTRRRMARERRGAASSLVSMETPYYKTIY